MSVFLLLACAKTVEPPPRPVLLPAMIDSRKVDVQGSEAAMFWSGKQLLSFVENSSGWTVILPDQGRIRVREVAAAPEGEHPAWDLSGPAEGIGGACEGMSGALIRVEDLGMGALRATWCGQQQRFQAGPAEAPAQELSLSDYELALACLEDQDPRTCEQVEDEVLRARGAVAANWAVGAGPVYELSCAEGSAPSPRPLDIEVRSGASKELVQQHAESLGLLTTQLQACAHERWRLDPCEDAAAEHRLSDPVTESDPLRACYDEVAALLVEPELLAELDLRITASPAPR